MTILELYEYAKERNILNYEIEVQYSDGGGYYEGSRRVYFDDLETHDDCEEIVL